MKKSLLFAFLISTLVSVSVLAENLSITFTYGIDNIARSNVEIPINITVENRDSQTFDGEINFNIFENSNSVYIYRSELKISEKSNSSFCFNTSLSDALNTISIDIKNKRDEIVLNERYNIDLSNTNNRLIIGILSNRFEQFSFLDGLNIGDSGIDVKIIKIDDDDFNDTSLSILDAVIFDGSNYDQISETKSYVLQHFAEHGKVILINGTSASAGLSYQLPKFVNNMYSAAKLIKIPNTNHLMQVIVDNDMNIGILPNSLFINSNQYEYSTIFQNIFTLKLFAKTIDSIKINYNLNNLTDYNNLSYLLNMIDKSKLPDIFLMTVFVFSYIAVLTIVIYSILRNFNMRRFYNKAVFISSLIFSFLSFIFVFRSMQSSVSLSYLSFVNIKDGNAEEKAFLNFRTNDSCVYSFNTNSNISLFPVLNVSNVATNRFGIINDINTKKTLFTFADDKTNIEVDNPNSFDSNIFVYNNDLYLNDIYNVMCSYERFDGMVTGRITNNMNAKISDASILLHDKVLKIGDIPPNYSFSLSRAKSINVPVGNSSIISEILAKGDNYNLIKYYLDENVNSYFDYAIFFGFIDGNETIDIDTKSVGDAYGKTMLVIKFNDNKMTGIYDLSSLQNEVDSIEGFYDQSTNSINGNEDVINMYYFDNESQISQLYIENLSAYGYDSVTSSVPFYGDIYIYNIQNDNYDMLSNNKIYYDELKYYLSDNNSVILKFVPKNIDPLYRRYCLPVLRAVASK